MPVRIPLRKIWLMGMMVWAWGSTKVISSLKSSLEPKARDPWIPYPRRGVRVPVSQGKYTLVEAFDAFFLQNALEAVYDSLVLRIEEGLVHQSHLNDFKGLHHKDLCPP